jgi:hypothetical protein
MAVAGAAVPRATQTHRCCVLERGLDCGLPDGGKAPPVKAHVLGPSTGPRGLLLRCKGRRTGKEREPWPTQHCLPATLER